VHLDDYQGTHPVMLRATKHLNVHSHQVRRQLKGLLYNASLLD